MRRAAAVGTIASVALASCFFEPSRPGIGGGGDGGVPDVPPACAGSVTWGNAHQLHELDATGSEQFSPFISADKTELWFTADHMENQEWHASRAGGSGTWGSITHDTDFFGASDNTRPHVVVSDDGLSAWFARMQSDDNILLATRMHRSDPFVFVSQVGFSVDGSAINEDDPAISGDGKTMVFTRTMGGTGEVGDLEIVTRASTADDFDGPYTAISALNTSSDDCCASLSADGNTLLYSSDKTGDYQIYITTRQHSGDPFPAGTLLPGQKTAAGTGNYDPVLSRDGLTILYVSDDGGSADHIWQLDGTCNQ